VYEIRIVPTTTDEHIAGFAYCLDAIARERRYFGIVEGPGTEKAREMVRALLDGGGVRVVAVNAAGSVVGWCDIERNPREGFRHRGRLGIGIMPLERGGGLGRRLMQAAIDAARAQGMERIELEVFASNARAIALYESLGFVREGLRRRSRKLDGRYDDDVMMALLFNNATGDPL